MAQTTQNLLPYSQPFHPTVLSAITVRVILERLLPRELAMRAVSFGYNPCLQKRRDEEEEYTTEYDETEGGYGIAALYLSSQRIPTGLRITTPRRIVFQTRAADQGFATLGGEGTFRNSHTWFEASILKPWAGSGGHPIEADTVLEEVFDEDNTWWDVSHARVDLRSHGWDFVEGENGRLTWKVCNNLTACATFRNYRVEWTRGVAMEVEDERAVGSGEGFLKLLKPGYKVVLWARAEYLAWINKVAAATIEIEIDL